MGPAVPPCAVQHRCRHAHRAPAAAARPPREVGVLVVREVSRIEDADVAEHRCSQQHPSATPAGDVTNRAIVGVVGRAEPDLDAFACRGQVGSQRVHPADASRPDAQLDHLRAAPLNRRFRVGGAECHPGPRIDDRDLERSRVTRRRDRDAEGGVPAQLQDELEGPRDIDMDAHAIGQAPARDVDPVETDALDDRIPIRREPGDRDGHVDERRLEQDLRAGGADAIVGGHGIDERTEPVGLDDGVVVHQRDEIDVVEVTHGPVATFGEPQVGTVLDESD